MCVILVREIGIQVENMAKLRKTPTIEELKEDIEKKLSSALQQLKNVQHYRDQHFRTALKLKDVATVQHLLAQEIDAEIEISKLYEKFSQIAKENEFHLQSLKQKHASLERIDFMQQKIDLFRHSASTCLNVLSESQLEDLRLKLLEIEVPQWSYDKLQEECENAEKMCDLWIQRSKLSDDKALSERALDRASFYRRFLSVIKRNVG